MSALTMVEGQILAFNCVDYLREKRLLPQEGRIKYTADIGEASVLIRIVSHPHVGIWIALVDGTFMKVEEE